jgi:hypothetical protein
MHLLIKRKHKRDFDRFNNRIVRISDKLLKAQSEIPVVSILDESRRDQLANVTEEDIYIDSLIF